MRYEDFTDRELVDELLDIDDGLTEWEVEFAEDLDKWLEDHDGLTGRQRGKAVEILKEKG